MRKITKKHVKKLKEGDYGTLIECIEYLLDTYDEDNFSRGYDSCMSDLSIHAGRLSDYLHDFAQEFGTKIGDIHWLDIEETKGAIQEYFNREINGR